MRTSYTKLTHRLTWLTLLAASHAACSSNDSAPAAAGTGGTPGSGGAGGGGDTATGGNPGDSAVPDSGGPTFDVTTKTGPVIGKLDARSRAFLGIPYAAAPTGPNRWRSPQPVTPWTTARDARTAAKVCPQIQVGGTTMDSRSSEDCLTLNVWTPDPAPTGPVPVMVWIHGGAFVFGSGAEPFYDGSELVQAGNIVVVTINYRIGALGFLANPALTAEDTKHPTSGNYGFEDQQAALRWVKENIGAFGGDPGQVTIFGESAGGYSVCAHLVAPGSQGLFHRAISESGYCSGLLGATRDAAYPNGDALARKLGCTDPSQLLTCLRGKAPDDFLHAFDGGKALPGGLFFQGTGESGDAGINGSQTWNPVVDGTVIPVRIADVGPDFPKVQLILGTNGDEGTLFTSPTLFNGVPVANDAQYQEALGRTFSATDVPKIVAQYRSADFKSPNDAINVVVNDSSFACPARRLARNAAAAGADVFLYAFHHAPEMPLIAGLGSYHAAEFSYVFGFDTILAATQPDEKPLATLMRGYWTRFVNTGDPNGGGAVAWPKYAAASDQDLGLDIPASAVETGYKKAKCDFWDSLYK